MFAHRLLTLLAVVSISASFCNSSRAEDPPPPLINTITATNGQKRINWAPYPAAQQYKIFRADDLTQPWVEDASGSIGGFDWTAPLSGGEGFHRLQIMPLSSEDLLTAN